MANVAFLWHMHQPYYVDPVTQTAVMPWVRLHSAKGYLDMISVIEDFARIRLNFNLTPVLLLQIKELIEGKIWDRWLEWSRKPAADLTEEERFAILENFFKIQWDNLVKPYPRYWELLNKRGLTFYRDEVRRGLRYFSNQELLDLQVWFNLAWCGYTARRLFPELNELIRKGRGFTEKEKHRVLDIHLECMRLVLRKYREAEERGQVELTTTPYFHPILPLVYDSALAERSLPGRQFPKRFHWPEDAAAHLTLAVEQHAALFGQPPRGLWPSEGSIAPELIPLMRDSGIEYFCSDEENLFNSLRADATTAPVAADHLELFQGWRVQHQGATVNALFREKPLSDFIGFLASKNDPREAAKHLLHHMRNIARQVPIDTGIIPLILDGENAWETFGDGGESFLRALYAGIENSHEVLHSCTIEDYFQHHPPKRTLKTLHTGSWIGSNFDIWIGEDEENRAWDLLGETRTFLQEQIKGGLGTEQRCAALREIYAAEGSDWFWWYGPDFSTENDALFDDLFRQHLKNVYTICRKLPPPALDQPITRAQTAPLYTAPTAPITPRIDGRRASFYKWIGAGEYVPASEHAAMFRAPRHLQRMLFGADAERLYLRFDLRQWEPFRLRIVFQEPAGAVVESEVIDRDAAPSEFSIARNGSAPIRRRTLAVAEVVEMSIGLRDLGLSGGLEKAKISFQVKLLQDGQERESYPANVPIQFPLANEEAALEQWIV
jgi:alpha-amylase/alpha-mannosidase (GH57 family)